MKYTVQIGGKSIAVAVDGDHVIVDGRRRAASLTPIPNTPLHQLTVDGWSTTVSLVHEGDGYEIQWGGRTMVAGVEDERTRQIRELTGGDGGRPGGGTVKAPMPGLVLRVEVDVGQAVEPDSGVVVLEAMKMENEIRAGVGGVVRKVLVTEGEAVEKGTVLVEIGEP